MDWIRSVRARLHERRRRRELDRPLTREQLAAEIAVTWPGPPRFRLRQVGDWRKARRVLRLASLAYLARRRGDASSVVRSTPGASRSSSGDRPPGDAVRG